MNNSNPFKKDLKKVRLKLQESVDILVDLNYPNNSIINNKENIIEKLFELITLIDETIKNKNDETIKNKPKKLSINSLPKGELKPKKLSINSLPKGFELIKQPGNGTCLYHSIVTSLNLMNIKTKYKFTNGFHLRKFLVEALDNIEKDFTKKPPKTNTLGNNQNALKEVYNTRLKELFLNFSDSESNHKSDDIYYEKSISERINILKSRISNEKLWGGIVELKFIAFIFQMCIYLWNSERKSWLIFNYEDLAPCNKTNSIFIIFNGSSHYDCLSPTDTNKFNKNFPVTTLGLLKYNFFKNKVNKPVENGNENNFGNFTNHHSVHS